jgi:anti-anti-sigma factor
VLALDGDLDLVTAPALADAALELIEAGAQHVVIDAGSLSFCDSSGLSAFVRIANRLEPQGGKLAIAGPQPIVRRVLEVSGLTELFLVTDEVPAAVAALGE